MANFIKWWNYKSFWILFFITILTMVLCLLIGLYVIFPWSLILIIIISITGGMSIRHFLPNFLNDVFRE